MKLLTGLFRAARKRLMTKDNDMGMFRDKINELVAQKDSLSDEEISAKVEELKGITNDLPDTDDKAKLLRFLEDFAAVKSQDPKVAEEAAGQVADMFEKLDTAAMQDVPGVAEPAPEEAADEEPPAEEGSEPEAKDAEGTEEKTAEEIAEETVAPDTKETEDDDPNAEYTLEEIYQFIKKRMAEDATTDSDEVVEEETEEDVTTDEDGEAEGKDLINSLTGSADDETKDECKEDDIVTDHAPHIPVTMRSNAVKGSLSALFDLAKRGN